MNGEEKTKNDRAKGPTTALTFGKMSSDRVEAKSPRETASTTSTSNSANAADDVLN